jgi:restriction system protein
MARRRSNTSLVETALQLGGLIVILAVVHPATRQHLQGIALIVALLALLVCVGLILFLALRRRTQKTIPDQPVSSAAPTRPTRQVEDSGELLDRVRHIDWFQFEQVVGLVYRKLGYSVERRGGAHPDGGIDLVITNDGERTAIQCKHRKTWNVGVKTVREFLGALADAGLKRGALVTLGGYTAEAAQLAQKHGIELIHEPVQPPLLEQTDALSDPKIQTTLADRRKFCPKCESEMVLWTATRGSKVGQRFWGCSSYPKCRFTLQV